MEDKEKAVLYLVAKAGVALMLAAVLEANGIDSSFLLGLMK